MVRERSHRCSSRILSRRVLVLGSKDQRSYHRFCVCHPPDSVTYRYSRTNQYIYNQSTNTTSRWLSRTTMIQRQPLVLQHRSSLHPMIHPRCSIVAAVVVVMIQTLWIITAKSTFTAAFHIQDGSRHRIPIGRTTMNREDTSWTIAWLMDRRPAPKSIVNRVRFGYSLLEMVKNRVGLEQKRESATPTGANDEFVIRMGGSIASVDWAVVTIRCCCCCCCCTWHP